MDMDNAQNVINKMNVPTYKMDLMKGTNVVWLIENLGVRNASHQDYRTVMQALVHQARTRNLMKRSVLEKVNAQLVQ